ncbi:mechanosensitive ion channel family protein, partial [Patescibacteria group bacterium]|nr:mechanosensitive ion channel family protein [Patescibacteria group bacterium]
MNLETIILGNTLNEYLYALGIFAVLIVVLRLFMFYIVRKLEKAAEKTKTDVDDTLINIVKSLRPPFYYFLAFYLATYSVIISDLFKNIIEGIITILIVYQIVTTSQILIDYVLGKKFKGREDLEAQAAIEMISKIIRFVLWVLGILLILSNLGVNITSLIAGLGIGGVATAFALKEILSDLFSSFAIYFDKPFKIGDFIQIGADKGTVIKIGIMTTRLKTSQGEELVMSNRELISSRIQNYKKMEDRRATFSFGVAYETPLEVLKTISKDIEAIVGSVRGLRFDRAHFLKFDESALNFEVVYFVESSDYVKYADAQQEINLKIMENFEKKGIEMAYPTRTVFVK